jgi:transposase
MKNFLDQETREALRKEHRHEKDRRKADRMKVVLLSDKGWSYKQIGEALLIDEETVSKHMSEYNTDKKLTFKTGGSQGKLSDNQKEELIKHLEETTYSNVGEICQYIESKYGIIYTVPGMTSWLKNNGFSYKKAKGIPAKANCEEQSKFIEAYQKLKKEKGEEEPILFLDGVHPTMATKLSYGWIKKGEDKLVSTTAARTRMNIIGSINLSNMQISVKDYATLDSSSMVNYLDEIRKNYPIAPKIHIILDQGRYNISKITKQEAKKLGIELHYLPPYSPNLNPIERLWKVMNEQVRNNHFFVCVKEFKENILTFFDKTWQELASNLTTRINDNFQILKNPTSHVR